MLGGSEENTHLIELPRVLITVEQPDILSVDLNELPDPEIPSVDEPCMVLSMVDVLSLQKRALWDSTIKLFFLINRDRIVNQVKIDNQFPDPGALQIALRDALFESSEEPENVPISFGVIRLEEDVGGGLNERPVARIGCSKVASLDWVLDDWRLGDVFVREFVYWVLLGVR